MTDLNALAERLERRTTLDDMALNALLREAAQALRGMGEELTGIYALSSAGDYDISQSAATAILQRIEMLARSALKGRDGLE